MTGPFDLQRFVAAQDPVLPAVLAELAVGRKRTHWMWFVFPQLAGLGRSAMAQRYALASLAEAQAYLAHSVLGPRLVHCAGLVNAVEDRGITAILGTPDNAKFHSCMTLFALAAPEAAVFRTALDRYFSKLPDPLTIERAGA